VEVRDCNISGAAQAISVMLGRRSANSIGRIADLTFDNITAISGVGPIACVVTWMPGHSIRNVRFRHLKFVTVGGIEKIAMGVPEYSGGYPEVLISTTCRDRLSICGTRTAFDSTTASLRPSERTPGPGWQPRM
jgi:hypothetical protein